MSSIAHTHFIISWALSFATGIPNGCFNNTGHSLVGKLQTPKAPAHHRACVTLPLTWRGADGRMLLLMGSLHVHDIAVVILAPPMPQKLTLHDSAVLPQLLLLHVFYDVTL